MKCPLVAMPNGLVPPSLLPHVQWHVATDATPLFPRIRHPQNSKIQFNVHQNNRICIVSNFNTKANLVLSPIQFHPPGRGARSCAITHLIAKMGVTDTRMHSWQGIVIITQTSLSHQHVHGRCGRSFWFNPITSALINHIIIRITNEEIKTSKPPKLCLSLHDYIIRVITKQVLGK